MDLVTVRRVILGLALLAALTPVSAFAQAPVPVYGDGPIPETGFTSWSLFLMCNPEWLLKKQEQALQSVFEAYLAFATTTGARHAAVWFIKPRRAGKSPLWGNPENLDIDRSVYFCQKIRLVPSEGPHVVVMTTHPDRWTPENPQEGSKGDPLVVLALGGSEPNDAIRLLRKLNDQVAAERLSQRDLNAVQYWQSWVRILETGCRLFDKVKFAVKASVVSVEKTGICT
jgi:hypothetical protein